MLITAENISVKRKGHVILDDVSISIEERDNITIIGPNGAGKTVLLKILLGLEKADRGCVRRKKGLRIGYMPQKLQLNEQLPISVEQFLQLSSKQKDGNLEDICKDIGISHIMKLSLHSLSGGQIQRVLLARSLLNEPELLILDEPAQNLDIAGQASIYRIIEAQQKSKRFAVVMVSHDLHMVMKKARKVVCLNGHICCSGAPESIIGRKSFTDIYGKDFADVMTFYSHRHDGGSGTSEANTTC